jgi:DMSO/TMAO reductase YedYZ molybdopterin-dependent catalytic subunit
MDQANVPRLRPRQALGRPPAHEETPAAAIGRRSLLRLGLLGLAGAHLSANLGDVIAAGPGEAPGDDRALIVRSQRPLNLESATAALDHRLTPNDAFFVRSHFGAPAVDLMPWEVELVGLVDRPLRLAPDGLGRLEQATKAAVLQCAGNGRGLYRPRVPGVPWERGAVGQAEWSGVRLADLLERAGLQAGAAHVHFIGGDAPPSPKMPAFVRSIPIDRARDPATILALRMNGEPLPVIHGGPVRLVVPGWAGNNWFKWVRKIVVARDEAPGFYMQTAYRMPRTPVPPGAAPAAVPLDPVDWMNVKSLITWPERGSTLPAGPVEVRGIAWTGQGHVTKVDVRIGQDDRWLTATLLGDPEPGAWRPWRLRWEPAGPGRHVIAARATDSMGQVQPESPAWNRSGYLWNGFDAIDCEVR